MATPHALASRTVWVEETAQLPVLATGQPPQVSALRLFEVTAEGERSRIRYTPRGQRYRAAFQPVIRELSKLLHERRLRELEPLLHRLLREHPEPPFDFFLSVYCVQIMQRARRKMPHLAQTAARVFARHWRYGPYAEPPGQPTLWALTTEILGPQGHARASMHAER